MLKQGVQKEKLLSKSSKFSNGSVGKTTFYKVLYITGFNRFVEKLQTNESLLAKNQKPATP